MSQSNFLDEEITRWCTKVKDHKSTGINYYREKVGISRHLVLSIIKKHFFIVSLLLV